MCKIEYCYATGFISISESTLTTLAKYKIIKNYKNVHVQIFQNYKKGYMVVTEASWIGDSIKIYYDNEFALWLAIKTAEAENV